MNNKFRNEKILKENLPKFEEIETSKLNRKYYSVTVISSIIVFSIFIYHSRPCIQFFRF